MGTEAADGAVAPAMSEGNSVVRENGARPNFNERLMSMRQAAVEEEEESRFAMADEVDDDVDADEVDTEPAAPKALRPGKKPDAGEEPSKVSKIAEKLNKERARLKTKRAEDTARSSIEEDRAQLRAELDAVRQIRMQLHERVSQVDPDDPVALERILSKLGGERVSKFILDQADPAKRAQAQQQVAPPPRSDESVERLHQIEAKVNEFFASQKKAEDEKAFQERVKAFDYDDEPGGAPFTAALMSKSPQKALKMAYAVMGDIVAEKQRRGQPIIFDDDDIILKMEEELSEFAALRSTSPQKQAAGLASRTRQPQQDEPDPADAPAEEERAPRARSKLSSKEAFERRMRNAARQLASLDRDARRR